MPTLEQPSGSERRESWARVHLFPKGWLETQGITDRKRTNQVANFTYVEWRDNMKISAKSPQQYVAELRQDEGIAARWTRMCYEHALPEGWEEMEYPQFLEQRRVLMAQIIRRGFESISGTEGATGLDMADGTPAEQKVWKLIEDLELELRRVVWSRYSEEWGDAAEGRIRKILGEESWTTIQRNREKYYKQYGARANEGLGVLDFCYLAQLGTLMSTSDAWRLFKDAIGDKPGLQRRLSEVTRVRNDFAHFRKVPQLELQRCHVAVQDLLAQVEEIERGERTGTAG